MPKRTSHAVWNGDLKSGNGNMKVGDAWEGSFSFASRFEDGSGTNPEELVGAAHAGCFSMALSAALGESGYEPNSISTKADVSLQKVGDDFKITEITLTTEADIPDIDDETFQQHAEGAKKNCPISKLFAGTEIKLNASLK